MKKFTSDSSFVKDGVFEAAMKRWGFIGSLDDNYKKGTTYIDLDNNGVYDKARLIGYFTNMTDLTQMLKHIGVIHDSMQDNIVNDTRKIRANSDSAEVTDGKIVGGEGRSWEGIPYGLYQEGGRSYRGFEITSEDNGLRKGVYRFYALGGGTVDFGNSARDGQFTENQFQKLIGEGKVKLLDSVVADEPKSVRPDEIVKLDPSMGKAIIKIGNTYNVATGVKGNNKSNITWENITMSSPNLNSLLGKDGRIKDSIKDVKQEYVFNWQDRYNNTKERTSIYANTVGEAIRELAAVVAFAGVGAANAYVVSVSPNDGYVALYGKLSDLVRSHVNDADSEESVKRQISELENEYDRNDDNPNYNKKEYIRKHDELEAKLKKLSQKKDSKMFKVTDKKSGKVRLVRAEDSLAAVKRVSSLKDASPIQRRVK